MVKLKLEKDILKILKIPPVKEDIDFLKEAINHYPGLDYLDEAKKMMAWLRDNPKIKNKKPRMRFRNWCRIAWERQDKYSHTQFPISQDHYNENQKLLAEIRQKLSSRFKFK